MERGDQELRFPVERRQRLAHRVGERLDIDWVVVIGRHRAHGRLPTHLHQVLERLVVDGRGRRCRILRIEREKHDAVTALRLQRIDLRGDRRIAVAHAPVDNDIRQVLQALRHQLTLIAGIGAQIAFVQFLVPDLLIGLAHLLRPLVEHDAIEDRIPVQLRPFDDSAIGQELGEIPPHRPVVGTVGRAEIDQQHADLSEGNGRMRGGNGCRRRAHEVFPDKRTETITAFDGLRII
ncbi:hypothetical protein D3C71_425530 [compost metagenome]